MTTTRKRSTLEKFARRALLLLIAWPLLAWIGANVLIVNSSLAHADALMVMAGSSTYFERTHHAAQLFNEGRAPMILLTSDNVESGWSAEQQRNPLFVERAADELRRQGVPTEKIEIVPGVVSSTYDETTRLREYATAHKLKSILVVTSAYQSRRVWWTLQRVFRGSDVAIGIDPAPPGEQSPRAVAWWLRRFGWKLVGGEYVKIVYYWIEH
jgi:uncharacterized SAM-binding protein YcdF (DUF218 family)